MIDIIDIHKSFGKNYVLRGVNLKINKGESIVVIGGSGSGKSVILKHIIGLLKPDKGTVMVDNSDISKLGEEDLNEVRKRFGMLFQSAALFDSMSVWENVGFGLRQHTHLHDEEIKEIAIKKLKMVGLVNVENLMPSELSGGMRKRVGLARAIAMEPEILLYDEPTTGLDPILADAINDLIIDMRITLNITSVAITHDMKSAYKIADRIAMLYNGVIVGVGTPDDVSGLDIKSRVKIAGVDAGIVEKIALKNGKAELTLLMEPDVKIYEDAEASLKVAGFLGDKNLLLWSGTSAHALLQEGDSIKKTKPALDIDQLANELTSAAAYISDLARPIQKQFGESEKKSLKEAIHNLKAITENVNEVVKENREPLRNILARLEKLSNSLGDKGPKLVDDLSRVANDLKEVIEEKRYAL